VKQMTWDSTTFRKRYATALIALLRSKRPLEPQDDDESDPVEKFDDFGELNGLDGDDRGLLADLVEHHFFPDSEPGHPRNTWIDHMETGTNQMNLINSIMDAMLHGKTYQEAIDKVQKETKKKDPKKKGLEARTLKKYYSEFIRRWPAMDILRESITGTRGRRRPRKRVKRGKNAGGRQTAS
jgi:hypothetical protein